MNLLKFLKERFDHILIIDYEFSQYKREGMIFEFTNVTDQQIIDIGGEDYLKKRKENLRWQ